MMDASEREQALRAMRASADVFYRSAVQIGVHPFIEFSGLMSATLDVLMQSRRDQHAARRLMRKLLTKHACVLRVLVNYKLRSYTAANRDLGLDLYDRQHKGLNNRAENSH